MPKLEVYDRDDRDIEPTTYADDCERLWPTAEAIAREVCERINRDVPLEQGSVKYARQHTLETVIGLLQGRV